jgi:hypothetical protein
MMVAGAICCLPSGANRVDDQDISARLSVLKRSGFFGALVRCIITAMEYGYTRVSTDGQSLTPKCGN